MAGGDGVIKSEMVGWHHELKRRELEQTPGDGKGQGSLALLHTMESQRVRHD